jgi:signal transduction histidine kinase
VAVRSSRLGLRLQILLALGGVILVAYLPLFFAIAQVTRATALAYRDDSARALGRAVAAHAADVMQREPSELGRVLESHVGESGALAIAAYDASGAVVASAGPKAEVSALAHPTRPYGEAATRVATRGGGRGLDIVVPAGEGAVLVRVRTDEDVSRTVGVVRGVALYMGVFALALLVFAYIVLTRGIVRPIEELSSSTDRVARGARSLEMPRSGGAREITDLATSVREMTARLLAEEQALRAKIDELTTTTRRLSETREQLAGSERLASVGRLAAGVAHEIGNPIAAIMGMHDLLDDTEIPADDRADFLKRMRSETERIHVVVRDLLDYARPERDPASGKHGVAKVADVVDDTLKLVKPQKEMRAVEAHVDVDAELRVAISPQRLTQVLLNLLLNAASALGGKPKGEPRNVTIRAKQKDARVRIEIEDDGPGVPADLHKRIFEPFVTTKDVGAGTGLGLAVCRGIVEGAGGTITLDPTYEGGARFVVELPRVAEKSVERDNG